MKTLIPVIHVDTADQAMRNAELVLDCGCKGFFLINHRIGSARLVEIAGQVRARLPRAWIGINVLDAHPLEIIPSLPRIDGFWVDDPELIEGQETQDRARTIRALLSRHHPKALYFGSVAFKYQPQPRDLEGMTRLAGRYMDVITTSGDATGHAADIGKVRRMHQAAGGRPLGLASGVSAGNARDFLPCVDWFLVASSISRDFSQLDCGKVAELRELIEGTPR